MTKRNTSTRHYDPIETGIAVEQARQAEKNNKLSVLSIIGLAFLAAIVGAAFGVGAFYLFGLLGSTAANISSAVIGLVASSAVYAGGLYKHNKTLEKSSELNEELREKLLQRSGDEKTIEPENASKSNQYKSANQPEPSVKASSTNKVTESANSQTR